MYYPRFSQSAIEFRLNPVFQDEVTIEPGEVIAVLAAATLLALEGLISQVMPIFLFGLLLAMCASSQYDGDLCLQRVTVAHI